LRRRVYLRIARVLPLDDLRSHEFRSRTSVGEGLSDDLEVITVDDVTNPVLTHRVHGVPIRLQHALYLIHPGYVLDGLLAESGDSPCISSIVPFRFSLIEALGHGQMLFKPDELVV